MAVHKYFLTPITYIPPLPPPPLPTLYGRHSTSISTPMLPFLFLLLLLSVAAESTTFTFVNKCGDTIWPGILSNSGSPQVESTGFTLPSGGSQSYQAPAGWSGRFWTRTGCSIDSVGRFSCLTGDCGSNQVECHGAGAAPPATLAEFTLANTVGSGKDFYDVSLVDGYNLPLIVESGSAGCGSTGCVADLNRMCPAELSIGQGGVKACRSACEAFGKPEYCCSGDYASPATCKPTAYSAMFKSACPKSYSYAYDDATSTFTCTGGDYTITFCPDSTSQKSSTDTASNNPTPSTPTTTPPSMPATTMTPPSMPAMTMTTPSTPKAMGGVMLEDESWLASLATGDVSSSTRRRPFLQQALLICCLHIIACVLLNFLLVL